MHFPVRLPAPSLLRSTLAVGLMAAAGAAFAQTSPTPVYQMQVPVQGLKAATAEPAAPAASLAFQDADGNALASLAFPDTSAGSNSAPSVVTLKNTGTAELTFNTPPAFTAAPFSLANSTCSGALAPSATCTVSVVFSPSAQQAFSGTLTTDSSIAAKSLPLSGTGTMVGVQQIAAGGNHTFVQKTDGTWTAAGYNASGQLGLGDTLNRSSFTTVPALAGATQVLTATSHTLAKLANGSWVGTGVGDRLGLGDTAARTSFVPVPALAGASAVVVGGSFTYAKLANGAWASTGNNWYGQLGQGDGASRTSFTTVPSLAGATQVLAGGAYAFAQFSNGEWFATGDNAYGQLGLGDTTARLLFTKVAALTGVPHLQVGSTNVFAQLSNGNWMAAGNNGVGQLGLGDTSNRTSFVAVAVLAGASRVVNSSPNHTFAKLSNGDWLAAGYNTAGQLALGTQTVRHSFTLAPALAGAAQVMTGNYHTFAQLADGKWAAVGDNGYGQLGLGDTSARLNLVPLKL